MSGARANATPGVGYEGGEWDHGHPPAFPRGIRGNGADRTPSPRQGAVAQSGIVVNTIAADGCFVRFLGLIDRAGQAIP
jgi:hypothetical protein